MNRKTSARIVRAVISVLFALVSLTQSLPNVQAANPYTPSLTQTQQNSVGTTTAHPPLTLGWRPSPRSTFS